MTSRIRFTTARQVVEAFPAAAGDLGDVPEDVAPLDYLDRLSEDGDATPGVVFAALALPKREAVWWACLTLRGLMSGDPATARGLDLAEAWVRHPEEEERRAAGAFAEAEFFEGPGAWIAFSAFSTGGSMAPAGLQAVSPSPEISGKSAAMAVMLAADDDDPFVRLDNLRTAMQSARAFGSGEDGTGPWRARGRACPTGQG